jgi:hypothetical protein
VSVATHTCGSDMRHDGPSLALAAGKNEMCEAREASNLRTEKKREGIRTDQASRSRDSWRRPWTARACTRRC